VATGSDLAGLVDRGGGGRRLLLEATLPGRERSTKERERRVGKKIGRQICWPNRYR
jgi:hypothetical protein